MGTTISKPRVISGWILAGLLTALFLFSAYGKFTNPSQMRQMKLGGWRIIIALGEITSTLIFLFPKTNKWGLILLSSYMGGGNNCSYGLRLANHYAHSYFDCDLGNRIHSKSCNI